MLVVYVFFGVSEVEIVWKFFLVSGLEGSLFVFG